MAESGISESVIRHSHPDIYQKCLERKPIKNDDIWFLADCAEKRIKGETERKRLNFSDIHFDWLLNSIKAYISHS